MSKKAVLFFAMMFSAIGAYVPMLFGDMNLLSGWSILGGFVGGIIGIWVGVIAIKRWG